VKKKCFGSKNKRKEKGKKKESANKIKKVATNHKSERKERKVCAIV
jgi:hypothetical protein